MLDYACLSDFARNWLYGCWWSCSKANPSTVFSWIFSRQCMRMECPTMLQFNLRPLFFVFIIAMLSFFRKNTISDGELTQISRQYTNHNEEIQVGEDASLIDLGYNSANDLKETIYDYLRTIRDPEKPQTLEDLNVVYESGIFVQRPTQDNVYVVRIEFNPTVPHCSLATLIGLCIRIKIERNLPHKLKLDIYIKKGTHETENEINKQINDKERIAAGMENPNLKNLVEQCIKDEE